MEAIWFCGLNTCPICGEDSPRTPPYPTEEQVTATCDATGLGQDQLLPQLFRKHTRYGMIKQEGVEGGCEQAALLIRM
jgi:hypothetical protein